MGKNKQLVFSTDKRGSVRLLNNNQTYYPIGCNTDIIIA